MHNLRAHLYLFGPSQWCSLPRSPILYSFILPSHWLLLGFFLLFFFNLDSDVSLGSSGGHRWSDAFAVQGSVRQRSAGPSLMDSWGRVGDIVDLDP